MSRDPHSPGEQPDDAMQWLDGLTGRAGQGAAHAEGQRLRDALRPDEPADMPPWAEIERRAGALEPSDQGSELGGTPSPAEAANQPAWRQPWYGIAAALMLAAALAMSMWPEPKGDGLRGVAPSGPNEAMWRVPRPVDAARTLASELQALGARVELQSDDAGARMQITAPALAVPAVNQRLAALETAVDAQGRLTLRVRSP